MTQSPPTRSSRSTSAASCTTSLLHAMRPAPPTCRESLVTHRAAQCPKASYTRRMSSAWTPEDQRHRLLPAERAAFDGAQSQGVLPTGWTQLQGDASMLWVGPGLTVARASEGLPFTLIEGAEARQLLIAHAFQAMSEERRRLSAAAAPGTPMAEALRAIAAAFPGFRPVDVSATGALFVSVPHALLACDGKYGELDWAFCYEGERAIDLVFQYGLSRAPADSAAQANKAKTDAAVSAVSDDAASPSAPRASTTSTAAPAAAIEPPGGATAAAIQRFSLAWTSGQRLRGGLLIALAALLAAPPLAAPLLLVDAVAWMIGTLALWSVAIPLGRWLLHRAEARAARPSIELTHRTLRVPLRSQVVELDRESLGIHRSWQRSQYRQPEHGGIRASEARMHLRGGSIDLLLVGCSVDGVPGFPETQSTAPSSAEVLELPPAEFRRLARALASATSSK